MKNKLTLLISLLVSCSSGEGPLPDEQPFVDQIGTVEQPIFLPQPYGAEKGDENGVKSPICSSPWAGGECQAPSNKTLDIKFYASTCSSWWQGVVVSGWDTFLININGTGFSVTTSSTPKYKVRCMSNTATNLCGTDPNLLGATRPFLAMSGHDTQLGTLRHYSEGDVWLCVDNFPKLGGWAASSDTGRKRAGANTFRHELFHVAGFGHYQGTGNHIMNQYADASTVQGSWFNVTYSVPVSMKNAMLCYDPTNDTQPNCPN